MHSHELLIWMPRCVHVPADQVVMSAPRCILKQDIKQNIKLALLLLHLKSLLLEATTNSQDSMDARRPT